MKDDGVLELGICAVDGDDVGTCGGSKAFDARRLHEAVRALQAEGLRVLVVSRRDAGAAGGEQREREREREVDRSRLLHLQCVNESLVDVVKVAHDYRCWFVTNGNVTMLVNDWRLPGHRQRWLRRVQGEFHVRFEFDPCGCFHIALPETVSAHLSTQRSFGDAPSYSRTAPAMSAVRTEDAPHVVSRSRGMSAEDETEPNLWCERKPGPVLREKDPHHQCEWFMDSEHPVASVLWLPNSTAEPGIGALLCVICEEKSGWIFPYAHELVGNVVEYDSLKEVEDDIEIQTHVVARAATSRWPCNLFTVVTAVGRGHHGLRAIGVGTNAKSRKRAALIALSTTVRVLRDKGAIENPSNDFAFASFVQRARGLFAEISRGPECSSLHIGQASGPGVSDADLARRSTSHIGMPAPMPSSSVPTAVSREAPALAPASAQSGPSSVPIPPAQPCRGVVGSVTRQGGGPSLGSLAGEAGNNASDAPLPATGLAHGTPQVRPSVGRDCVSTAELTHRVVVAMAAYDAEQTGYLSLRPGDRMCLTYGRCEPPWETDQFGSYVYGVRVGGPSHRDHLSGTACKAGWFPYDLVQFCE